MRNCLVALLGLCTSLSFGCSSDPEDVAGDYSISITNRENGCMFDNYTEGETSTNIPLTITQDGSDATGTVGGLAGGFLDLWLGSRVFQGSVSGAKVDLELFGTNSTTEGNCTYTVNSTISGTLSGDVLTGNLFYEKATNGNPDCSAIEGCATRQEFNGTRPPQ